MPRGTQTIAGVERAMDVLALFAESGAADLGVTEIAEALDLSKAVVHRILSSFRVKGFVELDENTRRYRIGPRTLTVGLSYLNRVDQFDVARSALAELADRTGETATQSVRAGDRAVYVGQVVSPRQVRVVMQLGASFPLHVGSASKVLLAFLPEVEIEGYVRAATTSDPHLDGAVLRGDLAAVRERGLLASWGEREDGVGSLSAPVRDHSGRVIASLSVAGPADRFRESVETHAEVLAEVAASVSRTLGAEVDDEVVLGDLVPAGSSGNGRRHDED